MIFAVLPCCAVLCCAVLCCAVLCCAVLCCADLYGIDNLDVAGMSMHFRYQTYPQTAAIAAL